MKRITAALLALAISPGAVATPDIETWTTANGASVYFVETHQIPMVQFAVGFDAAGARDPDGKYGLASLVSTLMDDGAGDMDEETIAEELASVGAQYSSQSARDMSVFELQVLSDSLYLDPAVAIVSKIIAEPRFPEQALERERQRTLVALEQEKQSAGSVAKREFYTRLFAGHPYGHMPRGDEGSVKGIARQDLVAFHQRHFTGSNAVIAIVGDLRRGRAEELAEALVGRLPQGTPPPPLPEVAVPGPRKRVARDFPSQQSHLLLGQAGVTRGDPDYFPLYVGNHILGGSGLISRLSVEIREDRGLAYSVYSYFVPMQRRGPYILGLQTKNDQAEGARSIALDAVRKFIAEGPTGEELQAAKNNITGGFPLRIDSNQQIADQVLNIAFYDLPLDYLDTYPDRVSAVSLQGIRDAFQRRIDPEHWLQVKVGPADE